MLRDAVVVANAEKGACIGDVIVSSKEIVASNFQGVANLYKATRGTFADVYITVSGSE
jgi:hypothetical protein